MRRSTIYIVESVAETQEDLVAEYIFSYSAILILR